MTGNDKNLRDILARGDETEAYDAEKESALRSMLASSFRGQMRSASLITWGTMLVFAGIAVVAAVSFFLTEQVREMILAATIFICAFLMVVVAKLWYWMLANRHAIQREVKRLQLQVEERKGK